MNFWLRKGGHFHHWNSYKTTSFQKLYVSALWSRKTNPISMHDKSSSEKIGIYLYIFLTIHLCSLFFVSLSHLLHIRTKKGVLLVLFFYLWRFWVVRDSIILLLIYVSRAMSKSNQGMILFRLFPSNVSIYIYIWSYDIPTDACFKFKFTRRPSLEFVLCCQNGREN